jgi:hypothetical protein
VLVQVLAVEHGAGPVVEAFGSDAIPSAVDRGHPTAVAVADRIQLVGSMTQDRYLTRGRVHSDLLNDVLVAADLAAITNESALTNELRMAVHT